MSSTASTTESVQQFVSTGGLAFGALGALAPRLLHRVYGTGDIGPGGLHMTQLWGTALAATGAVALMVPPEDRQRALAVAATMNTANTLFATAASDLPARARIGSAVSFAVFAAVAAYGARA